MPYQDWLVKMMQHSGTHPRGRIIALFDILNDWMDAPGLRQALRPDMLAQAPHEPLLDYLEQQARLARCTVHDSIAGKSATSLWARCTKNSATLVAAQ